MKLCKEQRSDGENSSEAGEQFRVKVHRGTLQCASQADLALNVVPSEKSGRDINRTRRKHHAHEARAFAVRIPSGTAYMCHAATDLSVLSAGAAAAEIVILCTAMWAFAAFACSFLGVHDLRTARAGPSSGDPHYLSLFLGWGKRLRVSTTGRGLSSVDTDVSILAAILGSRHMG